MSPFVIALVLTSTFMHAGWNLAARRSGDEGVFFLRMVLTTCLLGAVPFAAYELLVGSITATIVGYAAVSGVCSGIYFLALATAYASADFTLVYPVARALPVLMLGVVDALREREPTGWGWFGMAMVAAGCVLAPLTSLGSFSLRRYFNRATLAMLFAAAGTVGYSLCDKLAGEQLRQGAAPAASYCYLFFAMSVVPYVLLMRLFGRSLRPVVRSSWPAAIRVAVLSFGAYWLVVWAYQLSSRVSYVVAFRQFSIVIGVALAILWLRERAYPVRIAATAAITIGLVLIGLHGG
jgi:drug/metabolite transporter (DMT)-like permease